MRPVFHAGEEENISMRQAAIDAYKALGLNGHACIDMIPHKKGYMVINVDVKPSLSKDGRFVQSLQTTGVDLGQYIHSVVSYDPFVPSPSYDRAR
jgi:D-alanine-D-alanine ligase-like ATP-grasp enzyme